MNKILELEGQELGILLLHMNIMRDTVKKGMKRNYGALKGRKIVKAYDSFKDKLDGELEGEEQDKYYIEMNEEEHDILHSFLSWYCTELRKGVEKDGIGQQEIVVLELIENVKDKVEKELETA